MSGDITQTQMQDGDDQRRAHTPSQPPAAPQPPGEVPGYRLLRRLGTGAFGEVWLAVHRNNPAQQVAIKFYTQRGGDWALLAQEVEKLTFLATDSHVVQLLDVGWTASPPYYVMQYFEQGSLGRWLENGRLAIPDAVAIFRQIAVGLVHAHNRGVLHCDLKPDNILLDKDHNPRLADFGQSRLAGEQGPTLGTLFYMPPEQAVIHGPEPASGAEAPDNAAPPGMSLAATLQGAVRTAAPDARWDVYALGALLYGMLTGSPPYRTPRAEAFIRAAPSLPEQLERYRQVLLTHPKPAEHRRVPGIDRRLIDIIDRCLAVDPARRFANAQEVLAALDARALARARRPVFLLTGVVTLLLLLGMGLFMTVLLLTAVRHSETTLTQHALESNRLAAEFGAATAAREIELRWHALQDVADEPDFRELLRRAAAEPSCTGPRHFELQQRLNLVAARLTRTFGASPSSLFVTDREGTQLARTPFKEGKTVGVNYRHRDYFHGLGQDLERGSIDTVPITDVHLSVVFQSEADGRPRVAFSVPVWGEQPPAWLGQLGGMMAIAAPTHSPAAAVPAALFVLSDPAERPWPRLGVLGMSLEPGRFVELQPPSDNGSHVAILVDSRPDWFDAEKPGQRGLILQHPQVDDFLARHPCHLLPRWPDLGLLDDLWQQRQAHGPHAGGTLIRDHRDPFDAGEDNRWLAALAWVDVPGRRPEVGQTRWVVVVQQRYSTAVAPVNDLRRSLWLRGVLILSVLGFILAGLGVFVAWVLNESARSPLHRFLRRRAGLDSLVSGRPTPLLPLTIKEPGRTLPTSP